MLEQRNDIVVRFKRAMKRMCTIAQFAKRLGINMSTVNFDISVIHLHRRRPSSEDVIDDELIFDTMLTNKIVSQIDITKFFDRMDLVLLVENNRRLSAILRRNKHHLKELEDFIVNDKRPM